MGGGDAERRGALTSVYGGSRGRCEVNRSAARLYSAIVMTVFPLA
jgi:hypothetical protein